MVTTQDKAKSQPTERLPEWCAEAFPEQIGKMESDLSQSLDQIKKARARVDYIENIFRFCSKSLDGLEFADKNVSLELCQVLEVLGWKATPASTNPDMLSLKSENGSLAFAFVSVGSVPDRSHLGSLIMAQTELWQASGAEASAFVVYDSDKYGPASTEISISATKRTVGLLSKRVLIKKVAQVILAETDPDEARAEILAEMGL